MNHDKIDLNTLDWQPAPEGHPYRAAWEVQTAAFSHPETGKPCAVYRGMRMDDSFLHVVIDGEKFNVSFGDVEGVGKALFGSDAWCDHLGAYENDAWARMPEDIRYEVARLEAERELDEEAAERGEW